jgi:flavin reductase (DIM6/NTAB) family NADH-FMN oxidoreductase RutF
VLKKGQLDLADHYGRSARADKLAFSDWTNDRLGPPLLRKALAWFACQVVSELPAGDHVLVVGKVIDGTLVDSEAEPMCYRETGAMDGASTLYPDVSAGRSTRNTSTTPRDTWKIRDSLTTEFRWHPSCR